MTAAHDLHPITAAIDWLWHHWNTRGNVDRIRAHELAALRRECEKLEAQGHLWSMALYDMVKDARQYKGMRDDQVDIVNEFEEAWEEVSA